MKTKLLWLSILAVAISFIGGFLLANALNRNELNVLRAENERLKANPQSSSADTLTEEEIRQKITEADQNPQDFTFQKNLGIALYRYAAMKQDLNLLNESERILTRTSSLNSNDTDVLTALGNAQFDLGFARKENSKFQQARQTYQNILRQQPNDREVRIDLGLTYLFTEPAEPEKTAAELEKVLRENPKHERALQFMTQALIKQNKPKDAEIYLARLKELNPKNQFLPEFESQIKQLQ